MKREDLKALGIADEHIDAVMRLHGTDIETFKTQVTTLQGERDTAASQLTEANKAIESFKAMKPEELKAAADDYKAKFEQAQAESAKQLEKVKFDYALEKELQQTYKVKDVVAVKAHLKADAIQYTGEKFIGLQEQIDPLKAEKDFLFETDQKLPRIVAGGNNQTVLGDKVVDALRKGAGLPEPQGK